MQYAGNYSTSVNILSRLIKNMTNNLTVYIPYMMYTVLMRMS